MRVKYSMHFVVDCFAQSFCFRVATSGILLTYYNSEGPGSKI